LRLIHRFYIYYQELDSLLQKGEPGILERISDWIVAYAGLIWITVIFGIVVVSIHRDQVRQREYAIVASHLDELDRARAEALQGRFKAESCPICLDKFLLPGMTGADNKPLKLLRCGHVFDETCWSEWISSGQGQVDRCPICKQSVTSSVALERQDAGVTRRSAAITSNTEHTPLVIPTLERFHRERDFRLHRLHFRYPRFVQTRHIERWTSSAFSDSLSHDPVFTELNPANASSANKNKGSGSSSRSNRKTSTSFGGGKSSGGRGSRW